MKQTASRQRRGTALIAVLVCLVIVMALLGNMLVGALRIGRQMRGERDRRQCELLLQAGLDRAALRASAAAPYSGEVWNVSSADISGTGDGQVTIRVSRQGDTPTRSPLSEALSIRVLAEYPVGSDSSIRRSRTAQLQNTTPLPQE
jgi:Tfp pilus assembly protein PilV